MAIRGSLFLEWAAFVYQIEIALVLCLTLYRQFCVTLYDHWSSATNGQQFFERAVSRRFSNRSNMISHESLFRWGQRFWISVSCQRWTCCRYQCVWASSVSYIVGFPDFMSRAFSFCLHVEWKGCNHKQCFSFCVGLCVRYIASVVLF